MNKMKKLCHILKGHLEQQRYSELGTRPTVVGQRPTTDIPTSAEFRWSEENESYSVGHPELIYSLGLFNQQMHSDLGWRPTLVGRSPTTYLLNCAELGCIEENKCCTGGDTELIYCVG